MNEFAEILNLFIANVIAYTFFVAVYGFIIYNVGKIILYLVRYAVYHIRRDINSKEDYDEIADEIFRLRELRQKTTVDTAARDEQIKRINDLQD